MFIGELLMVWRRKSQSDEDRVIDKYHDLVKPKISKAINKYNFKIQFHKPTWVLKQICGGFDGHCSPPKATQLDTTSFGVLSVDRDKATSSAKIHVWSDGACDGYNLYLINVPKGLFKEVHDIEFLGTMINYPPICPKCNDTQFLTSDNCLKLYSSRLQTYTCSQCRVSFDIQEGIEG
jgi:hypothetical protein